MLQLVLSRWDASLFRYPTLLTRDESIFGMHLFDTTDPGVIAAQKKFWNTIFLLCIGTYGPAFAAIWFIGRRDKYLPEWITEGGKEQGRKGEEAPTTWKDKISMLGELLIGKGKSLRVFRRRGENGQISDENIA